MAFWLCGLGGWAAGQISGELPPMARGIDVDDKVGQFIPLELVFADENGNPVGLRKYFKQGKPIILTLNYSDCPGLCIAQLDNLVGTLREMDGAGLGEHYEIVTVSIDPTESPDKAARTKAKYVGLLRGTAAEESWHFLTGKQAQISKLADSVGFRYTYDKVGKRYNHPAATYFISSDGRICRYLLSLGVEPDQLKLAVAEAGEGKLTYSLSDAFVQLCYMYDPELNRYSANAKRLLTFAGAAFVLLMTGFTAPFWFSWRTPPAAASESPAAKPLTAENDAESTSSAAYNTVANLSVVESTDRKE